MRDLCGFPAPLRELRYDGPALVHRGRGSDYVAARSRPASGRCSPGARSSVIADAGHWVHADQPAALLCGAARLAGRRLRARRTSRSASRSQTHGDTHVRQPARSRPRLPPLPDARQDLGDPDQGDGHAARPGARLFAGRGRRLHGDRRATRPRPANLTSRANLVAVITNGTAVLGLGNIGAAGRQAGDGRQGLPVQEVRRHRRVRHRARRERPRHADRHHRAHGADLRRHQPRGHQGARVLLHREASCASA